MLSRTLSDVAGQGCWLRAVHNGWTTPLSCLVNLKRPSASCPVVHPLGPDNGTTTNTS